MRNPSPPSGGTGPGSGSRPGPPVGPAPPPVRSARDLVIALIVLLVPVALVVAVYRLRGGEDVVLVDPAPAVEQARAAGAFPVALPSGLSDRWRPLSATFRRERGGSVLRIGYLTPGGGAVQLVQSNEPEPDVTARELGDRIRSTDAVMIGPREWQSFRVRGDEAALVHAAGAYVVIIIGRAEPAELIELAAALA